MRNTIYCLLNCIILASIVIYSNFGVQADSNDVSETENGNVDIGKSVSKPFSMNDLRYAALHNSDGSRTSSRGRHRFMFYPGLTFYSSFPPYRNLKRIAFGYLHDPTKYRFARTLEQENDGNRLKKNANWMLTRYARSGATPRPRKMPCKMSNGILQSLGVSPGDGHQQTSPDKRYEFLRYGKRFFRPDPVLGGLYNTYLPDESSGVDSMDDRSVDTTDFPMRFG